MLQTIYAALHWPLLVAASLALLAVRPFPSDLANYAARAEELVRQFIELRELFAKSPRSRTVPSKRALLELHLAFKSIEWPDAAASYHWAVSEAMRYDLEALAHLGRPRQLEELRAEAQRYWRRAEDETFEPARSAGQLTF